MPPSGSSEPQSLNAVLTSAARLQELVPGAVLVGGSAAAYHARHRLSFDHDHVVADLADRFETVLDHLEALGDWSTARAQPGKIVLGSLGGIESGIRQLRRTRPLEIDIVDIAGRPLRVPTAVETLRIKAWLALTRNQTRDYLDIAALADRIGLDVAAAALAALDVYYADLYEGDDRVATQVARQLADPRPRDSRVTRELAHYKQLDQRWHDWAAVVAMCRAVAERMVSGPAS
ncbi:MAG TPA: hypothetical protein VNQ73_04715 [Ilumatobacter sp.]|nr:hypothetical protein [Ilumatobacter sp.]